MLPPCPFCNACPRWHVAGKTVYCTLKGCAIYKRIIALAKWERRATIVTGVTA